MMKVTRNNEWNWSKTDDKHSEFTGIEWKSTTEAGSSCIDSWLMTDWLKMDGEGKQIVALNEYWWNQTVLKNVR